MSPTTKKRLFILIGGTLTLYRLAHLKKILKIMEKLFDRIVVIYEAKSDVLSNFGKIKAINIREPDLDIRTCFSFASKLRRYFRSDLSKALLLLKYSSRSDCILFLGIYQPLSLSVARLIGSYPIHFCGGFDVSRSFNRNKFLNDVYLIIRWAIQIAMLKFSKRLIFETPSVMSKFNLSKFKRKSYCNGHLFVDLNEFSPITPLYQRNYDIGYIGALSEEKGVMQFVRSLPLIMDKKEVKVQIVGDGALIDVIKSNIFMFGLGALVDLKGQVEHSKMPQLLNTTKLLVVPSYSEGLPNIILEAMSCGTVVVASTVGGIPDIIKQGENGFLLRSNNPEEIAQKIIELIDMPQLLERVSKNAYEYVAKKFGYEQSLKNWVECFNEIKLET